LVFTALQQAGWVVLTILLALTKWFLCDNNPTRPPSVLHFGANCLGVFLFVGRKFWGIYEQRN
jgi:hypothetical protein